MSVSFYTDARIVGGLTGTREYNNAVSHEKTSQPVPRRPAPPLRQRNCFHEPHQSATRGHARWTNGQITGTIPLVCCKRPHRPHVSPSLLADDASAGARRAEPVLYTELAGDGARPRRAKAKLRQGAEDNGH